MKEIEQQVKSERNVGIDALSLMNKVVKYVAVFSRSCFQANNGFEFS